MSKTFLGSRIWHSFDMVSEQIEHSRITTIKRVLNFDSFTFNTFRTFYKGLLNATLFSRYFTLSLSKWYLLVVWHITRIFPVLSTSITCEYIRWIIGWNGMERNSNICKSRLYHTIILSMSLLPESYEERIRSFLGFHKKMVKMEPLFWLVPSVHCV